MEDLDSQPSQRRRHLMMMVIVCFKIVNEKLSSATQLLPVIKSSRYAHFASLLPLEQKLFSIHTQLYIYTHAQNTWLKNYHQILLLTNLS